MKLYELTEQYAQAEKALSEMMAQGEIDEQIFVDTMDGIESEFDDKCEQVAKYIKNLEAMSQAIKQEEQAMKARRTSAERHADRLKAYLKQNLGS
jgi:ABC-type proline/glycine betaine transport system substrate-binding protein